MSCLEANIEALRAVGSDLPDRLSKPTEAAHLTYRDDGVLMLRIHRSVVDLRLRSATIALALEEIHTPPESLLVVGIGMGELLEEAFLRWSETRVFAWERDPALLCAMLCHLDCSEAILSGRLQLLLGVDLVDALDTAPANRVFHPLLAQIYWREREFIEGPADRPRALVAEGTLYVDDLSQALHQEGFATWTWSLVSQSREESLRTARRLAPRCAFSINYTHGLTEFCAEVGIPLLIWEIDPSISPVQAPRGETGDAHVFSWSRPQVRKWKQVGFESAHYLPLAANPEHRRPQELTRAERSRYEADICFVGSSLLGQVNEFRTQLRDGIAEWLTRRDRDPRNAANILDAILMHQRSELQRYVIPELVEGSMPGFLAEMKALKIRFDPIMLMGELAAAERRLSVIATMGETGIHVWGDPGWRCVRKHGVRFRGSAGHREELNKIYNAARIHVDIGRVYQLDIVTMRVFDVISCGGFVIAERNKALLELFDEGTEIETWVNVNQLKEKCRHYLAHPEEAAEIARRGRERLLAEHSIRSRLQQMLEVSGTSG